MIVNRSLLIIGIIICFLFNFAGYIDSTQKIVEKREIFDIVLNDYNSQYFFLKFPVGLPIESSNPFNEYSSIQFMKKFVPDGWSVHSKIYYKYLEEKRIDKGDFFNGIINNPNAILLIDMNPGKKREEYLVKIVDYLNTHYSEKNGNNRIILEQINISHAERIKTINPEKDIKLFHLITENSK